MPVSIDDCKKAVVKYLKKNPGHVAQQFGETDDGKTDEEFEKSSLVVSNWNHRDTQVVGTVWERAFDCEPYEDQLRAYVKYDGEVIVEVMVQGE